MNPGIEAIHLLTKIGYRAWVEREAVRLHYEGFGDPDPIQVQPLIELVRANKPDVVFFLKCYCPGCGGVASCPDYEGRPMCLACDWDELIRLYPDMARVKH